MMIKKINTLIAIATSSKIELRAVSTLFVPHYTKIQKRIRLHAKNILVSINRMIEIGKYILAFLNATIKISCSIAILMYASSGLHPIKISQSGWTCYDLLPIRLA